MAIPPHHAAFAEAVAGSRQIDYLPTFEALAAETGIRVDDLVHHALVRWAAAGSEALLAVEPRVLRNLFDAREREDWVAVGGDRRLAEVGMFAMTSGLSARRIRDMQAGSLLAPAPEAPPRHRGASLKVLLRRPGYVQYLAAVAAARTAGAMFNVAVVALAVERTGSLAFGGLLLAAGSLPAALSGPLLGSWFDAARSRRTMIVLDQLIGAAALAGLLTLTGAAPDWILASLAAVYGISRPVAVSAFSSVLPEVVGPGLLRDAEMIDTTTLNLAFIVGPAFVGLLAAETSASWAVVGQICLMALAGALISTNPVFELGREAQPVARRRSVVAALSAMWSIVPLRAGAIAALLGTLGWGSLGVGFPALAEHLGAPASAAGYLWASIAAGSVLSAVGFNAAAARVNTIPLLVGSSLAMGLSALGWLLAGTLPVALLLVSVTGLFEGPALVAAFTVRQRHTPPHLRGRVFATVTSLNFAGLALGALVAGYVNSALGLAPTVAMFTVSELLMAICFLCARMHLVGCASHA